MNDLVITANEYGDNDGAVSRVWLVDRATYDVVLQFLGDADMDAIIPEEALNLSPSVVLFEGDR